MSDIVADLAPAPPTGLMGWLRYDASRVPDVEAAYDEFIRVGQPVPRAFGALALGFVVALVLFPFISLFSRAAALTIATAVMAVVMYGSYIAWMLQSPRDVLLTILHGCVDVRRACIFAVLCALPIAAVDLALAHWLVGSLSHRVSPTLLLQVLFIVDGLLSIALAPIAEEFFFQGWLQTRLRNTGSLGAPLITTVLFLLYHGPRRPADFARTISLGFNAYLRSTTRSLAACIAAHAANNVFVFVTGFALLAMHVWRR